MRGGKADDTRERLLRAATEVFAEKGYAAATVRDICTRADANVALINYYFGDKLELYTQVLQEVVSSEPRPQVFVRGAGDPEAALRALIATMLERASQPGSRASFRFRLIMNEFVHPSEATVRMIDITMRPLYEKLCTIVSEIVGLPASDDQTRLCVHSLLGQVAHFAHSGQVMEALWPQMQMTPKQRTMIAEHIGELMLTYLRSVRVEAGALGL